MTSILFRSIQPTPYEVSQVLPGDNLIADANVVMNRAFSLPAAPEVVWPWLRQLGKHRAGWYFSRPIEWFILPHHRGLRMIDQSLQHLAVGERIDDWGGKDGYLELAIVDAPRTLVYISTRGAMKMSWAITLWPAKGNLTRVVIRLRFFLPDNRSLLKIFGELIDALTISGLAAGLRSRVR